VVVGNTNRIAQQLCCVIRECSTSLLFRAAQTLCRIAFVAHSSTNIMTSNKDNTAAASTTTAAAAAAVDREPDRVLVAGRPDFDRCDNKVISARYTMASFFPKVSEALQLLISLRAL
jgi:hypothetical protein